jgi:hypothetical protein
MFSQHLLGSVEEKIRKASVTVVCAAPEIQIGLGQNIDYFHQASWLHASDLYSAGALFESRLRHNPEIFMVLLDFISHIQGQ